MGLIDDLQYTQNNLNIIRTKTTLVNNESLERVAKAVNNMQENPYLQIKNVVPGTTDQKVLPDDVYLALSEVNVSGDSDLLPENIKQGVTIFGVEGTLQEQPELQEKEVLPSTEANVIVEPDEGVYGLSKVTVRQIRLESKVVTPQDEEVIVTPSYGQDGLDYVRVKPIISSNITIEPNFSDGDITVDPSSGEYFNKVIIKKDENLRPEYIKEGIVINGIVGTYKGQWYTEVNNGTLEIHGDADVEGGTLDL